MKALSSVRILFPVLFICVLISADLHALETPVIINRGEATKLATPSQVEFVFKREFGGERLSEAVAGCEAYRHAALALIRESELQPADIHMSPVVLRSSCLAGSSIALQFSMAAFNGPSGAELLAALCDKMTDLAATLNASLDGPSFSTAQAATVEADAVARATENAYPHADAISDAQKSTIFAIEKVEILEVTWEQHPEEQYGETAQIACTAKVEVTYMLTTQ